jgi:hypothetical protein
MSRNLVRAALAAGMGGTFAITASSTLEMRLRGRAPSSVPGDAVERILGRRLDQRSRQAVGSAAHVASGLALGLPRALLARAGVHEPLATALFLPIAWTPDLLVVPALGVADPPWRWGPAELAISALHHVAYALGAAAALAALRDEPLARRPLGGPRIAARPRRA